MNPQRPKPKPSLFTHGGRHAYRRIPRDISPALVWRLIKFASELQRAEPGTAFVVVRAAESEIIHWSRQDGSRATETQV